MKDRIKILIRVILIFTVCAFTREACIWADPYSASLEPVGVVKDTLYEDFEKTVPSMIIHKLEDDGWSWHMVSEKEIRDITGTYSGAYIVTGFTTYVKEIFLLDEETVYDKCKGEPGYTFGHETAHAMSLYLDGINMPQDFVKEIYNKEYVSEYAKTNSKEYYAETFAFLSNDPDTVLENAPKTCEYVLRDARTMMEMR